MQPDAKTARLISSVGQPMNEIKMKFCGEKSCAKMKRLCVSSDSMGIPIMLEKIRVTS